MQQQANRGYSLIQDSGAYSSSCGYCNNTAGDQSTTHGMHAYRLNVYDYQELLDQGWRRSGKFLYKPNNKTTCCRQYTIRLSVDNFEPTKTHKRLLRKWDQFLAGQLQHGQEDVQMADSSTQQQQQQQDGSSSSQCGSKRSRQTSSGSMAAAGAISVPDATTATVTQQQQQQQVAISCPTNLLTEVQLLLQQAVAQLLQQGQLPQQQLPAVNVILPPPQKLAKLPAGTGMTSSCAHALAAAARKWRQQQQVGAVGNITGNRSDTAAAVFTWSSADDLARAIVDVFNNMAKAVPLSAPVAANAAKGHINFATEQQQQLLGNGHMQQQTEQQQQRRSHSSTQLLQQQEHCQKQEQAGRQQQHQQHRQASCHETPQPQQQQQQQEQAHRLEVRMVPNQFIQAEYELYCKYQINQHHDAPEDLTPARYKNFLVDTPLVPVMPPSAAAAAGWQPGQAAAAAAGMPPCGYGSFHQQYWLDGKLVAVGVVDVLPRCLSSKYFFWDPDYAWLSLGRYGALREISWVRSAHASGAADLQYYYLGYYIHTCPKMAYKAEYAPSELLCPQRQVWVKIDDTVLQALDRTPYVVLSDLPGVQTQPNLSVPRSVPQGAAGAAGAADDHAAAAGGSAAAADQGNLVNHRRTRATAADGGGGSSGLQGSAVGEVPQQSSLQEQIAAQQQRRQALDSQLLFLLKQPVRWGAIRESGMLDGEQISVMEERLQQWRAVVGETAAHLLYVTTDLL